MFFCMDPTNVTPEKIPNPTSVVSEKHQDLTRLNKDISDPTSKRRSKDAADSDKL